MLNLLISQPRPMVAKNPMRKNRLFGAIIHFPRKFRWRKASTASTLTAT